MLSLLPSALQVTPIHFAFELHILYHINVKTIRVTTFDISALEPYRTLRRPQEHQTQGIFVAEGEKVVRRLLESKLEVISLLLTDEWFAVLNPVLRHDDPDLEVFTCPKKLVETIVGFPLHQGIMAVGKIPPPVVLDDLLRTNEPPLLLAAVDGLTNSENLGVLVRNCAAFGVQALLVGETSSSPYLRRAVRNSMGAVFTLPIVHLENLAETIRLLENKGITGIAAHPRASTSLSALQAVLDSCCIVFGSEGVGISDGVLAACTAAARIIMDHEVDSLNVASASAVFLHEVRTRRASARKT